MSKQSERRKRQQLATARAEAQLLQAQQRRPNQTTETKSNANGGKDNPKIAPVSGVTTIINSVAILTILGGISLAIAAFIQFYNHTVAIWLFF